MLKKINKIIILVFFIKLINCNTQESDVLKNPKIFVEQLEQSIAKYYYFSDSIPNENYLEAIKIFEPDIKNISIHNAREYFIEYLRKNSEKPIAEKELIYKKATYYLIKNFKGRNLYIPPSVINSQKDKENTAGIGLVLFEESFGKILVIDVIEGSPAYIAEIKPNQYLQAIDGTSIENFFLEEITTKIKGKAKTPLQITIQGVNYTLYRSNFSINPIRKILWNYKNKKILYLQIRFFSNGLEEIIKQNLFDYSNIDYLVLDLRYLSSGEIEEVYKVADLFLPEKKILKIHLKNEKPIEFTTSNNVFYTGKLFVLYQEKSSPFAFALARLLESSENVKVLGPNKEIPIYIGKQILLNTNNQNNGAFYLTNGMIEFLTNQNKKNIVVMENYISNYPPGPEPNKEDEFHKKILNLIDEWN